MTVSGLTITRAWRQPGHRQGQDDPENPIRLPKQWPGPFPFQDSYLLSQGKYFCVERRAVREDYDDLIHSVIPAGPSPGPMMRGRGDASQ